MHPGKATMRSVPKGPRRGTCRGYTGGTPFPGTTDLPQNSDIDWISNLAGSATKADRLALDRGRAPSRLSDRFHGSFASCPHNRHFLPRPSGTRSDSRLDMAIA